MLSQGSIEETGRGRNTDLELAGANGGPIGAIEQRMNDFGDRQPGLRSVLETNGKVVGDLLDARDSAVLKRIPRLFRSRCDGHDGFPGFNDAQTRWSSSRCSSSRGRAVAVNVFPASAFNALSSTEHSPSGQRTWQSGLWCGCQSRSKLERRTDLAAPP